MMETYHVFIYRSYIEKIIQKLHTINLSQNYVFRIYIGIIDETFEQYDDSEEWFSMLQNELGCTKEELEEYGICITKDGGLSKNFF